jgi:glycosyltransferase involved in cell wall biosynthesis
VPLTVGSWPGPGDNYVGAFAESLTVANVAVVGLHRPWTRVGKAIDVLHIHWPEQIFWDNPGRTRGLIRAAAVVGTLAFLRIRGMHLVWCVHNLEPHDAKSSLLKAWLIYANAIAFLVNGFVTLSPSTIAIARKHFVGLKRKPAIFVWQPRFNISYSAVLRSAWRKRYNLDEDAIVLGLIGTVKGYKGISELITTFACTNGDNLRLVVAGRTDDIKTRDALHAAAARDSRILLNLRWLTDEEILGTTLATDAIILPFVKTLHSASLIYGLCCGKVVITPSSPFATDIQSRVGQEWVKTYRPPLSAEIISATGRQSKDSPPNLDFLSIKESGAKLSEFYQSLK